jgi:hypothetical protein
MEWLVRKSIVKMTTPPAAARPGRSILKPHPLEGGGGGVDVIRNIVLDVCTHSCNTALGLLSINILCLKNTGLKANSIQYCSVFMS